MDLELDINNLTKAPEHESRAGKFVREVEKHIIGKMNPSEELDIVIENITKENAQLSSQTYGDGLLSSIAERASRKADIEGVDLNRVSITFVDSSQAREDNSRIDKIVEIYKEIDTIAQKYAGETNWDEKKLSEFLLKKMGQKTDDPSEFEFFITFTFSPLKKRRD